MRSLYHHLAALCLFMLFLTLATDPQAQEQEKTENMRWVVYYDDELPPERFLNYDVIIFDSVNHPRLRQLQNRGKTLLGYVSFGEVEKYRDYYKDIEKMGILLDENPNWPGHFVVDARDPRWAKYLIEVLVPDILHKGFDGIMIDTIDSIVYLETLDQKQYSGMAQAAANLIRAVRQHYPEMPIMVNRGIEILQETEQYVDMLMAESIYVEHDFATGKNSIFPESEYLSALNDIKASQERAPHLEVFALEYWDPADKEGVRKIYDEHRSNGLHPFVSVIGLDELHEIE